MGEVETVELGKSGRRVAGLTTEEIGLMLAEGKSLNAEPSHAAFQIQMEEFLPSAALLRNA